MLSVSFRYYLTLGFFIFLVGCASRGSVTGTSISNNQIPRIDNLILINQLSDYDVRYRDSITQDFSNAFTQELLKRMVRADAYNVNDIRALQQTSANTIAAQKGFTYILSVRFFHYTRDEFGRFSQGDLEARLWRVGDSSALWVGTFKWHKGCGEIFGSNCSAQQRAQTLASLIFTGLDKDKILPVINTSSLDKDTKEQSANNQFVDVGKPTVIYSPDADQYYPSYSKSKGEQGEAVVRLIINETGVVEEARLLQSSSYPRLDRAAIEIGKRYRFKPYTINGSPSKISTNLLIKFSLK